MKENKDHSVDVNEALMNKALSYLSKFSSTENKLKTILNSFSQKYLSSIKKDILDNEIIFVIQKCKNFGYIDDEKFTKTKIENYINLGKSKKNIVFNLKNYGINDLTIEKSIEEYFNSHKDNDFKAAIIFIRKKNIGPFFKKSLEPNPDKLFNKWYGSLARAGFNFEISKKVLNIKSSFEAENILCNIDN